MLKHMRTFNICFNENEGRGEKQIYEPEHRKSISDEDLSFFPDDRQGIIAPERIVVDGFWRDEQRCRL